MTKDEGPAYTVPGVSREDSSEIIALLQQRLHALNDLHLTLKHIHWNVVGPHFIAVHEMIDPQVDQVRSMTDDLAERISTLGGVPKGTPGALVAERSWDDYSIGRAEAIEHLGALDLVYTAVVGDHRAAMDATETLDPVTQDMLIEQLRGLELFQWFVRAHLESSGGRLSTRGAATEKAAADQAGSQARNQP
ncbi:Dps family protein [Streptomyces genisteinicus]|uniref:DNA starvation/stationary phase protection protein n=1 Tax=Streptomyces genisteinicus TaxID=2768068 RepID=A0A7H0HNF7_9ACTN|nr:DNA starvation/stationary phase protection protein [Streptomyces genisteinicus]QNP62073.1 DNA starvation/stationary phase protection protein [Streptomyces genisteinicus]